ncbi:MAG: Rrf2 family transcriptional regulator [Pseudomonadota bacterium]
MLRLSKKLLFAIEAVVDIAYHGGTEPVRSVDISRRQGIPRRYLEQVLQHLVHHRILAGQRGPKGGYRLAREKRRISLGEIVRIVRQLEGASDPANEPDGSEIGVKVVRPIWIEMQLDIMAKLDNLTVEQLCESARNQGIGSEAAQVSDFII